MNDVLSKIWVEMSTIKFIYSNSKNGGFEYQYMRTHAKEKLSNTSISHFAFLLKQASKQTNEQNDKKQTNPKNFVASWDTLHL